MRRGLLALALLWAGLMVALRARADDSGSSDLATGNWGGLRDRMAKAGYTFGLTSVGEGFWNFTGGIATGGVLADTTDLNVTVDLGPTVGLAGGKFYADLEDHAGRDPSLVLTGDLQAFDKLNYTPYLQMFELYYEQKLFHDRLRLKVGKVDANSEYSVIDNGLDFIDASTQVTPTVLPFPTTPDPMPSVNVFYTPANSVQFSFGAFWANQDDRLLVFSGQPWALQPTRNGAFLIQETDFKWDAAPLFRYDGNFKVGAWGHTGTFPRLAGGERHGAQGWYAFVDQTLWKPTDQPDEVRGIRAFLEYGHTDADVGQIWQHAGGGLVWKGFRPDRPDDEIGIAEELACLSNQARLPFSHEDFVETFYKTSLAPWATVQPDVQFIAHPGGTYRNALVALVQLSVQM